MPLVGGDLRIVDIVDLCFFGTVTILFFAWLFTTRKGYLKSVLWYTSLSNLARAVLALLLLFQFSSTIRSDGVTVLWVRWMFYAIIFGLCGITHAIGEVSCQRRYFYRWCMSLTLGLAFVAIWVASKSGENVQRIIALALSGLPYLAFSLMLWMWAWRSDWKMIITLLLFNGLLVGYPLFFALGHSGWNVGGFSLVWETSCYLVLDAVLISLLPAFCAIIHCPCACGDAGKKHDYLMSGGCVAVEDPESYATTQLVGAPINGGGVRTGTHSGNVISFPPGTPQQL